MNKLSLYKYYPNIIFRASELESAILMAETNKGVILLSKMLEPNNDNLFSLVFYISISLLKFIRR